MKRADDDVMVLKENLNEQVLKINIETQKLNTQNMENSNQLFKN